MKLKRILATIVALAVASAATLSMTIVIADTRDRVAGFDGAKVNDYDLVDYEDMTEETEEPVESEPEDADPEEGETAEPEEGDPEITDPDTDEPDDPVEPEPEEALQPGDILTYEDFTFEVQEDGTLSVTDYTGGDEIVAIPEEIDGITVTAISDMAFAHCTALRWVYIPEGVAYIGADAFVQLSDEGDEDEETYWTPDIVIFGHSGSCAETYADENALTFFAVGGVTLTDSTIGIEVVFQDTDGSEDMILSVMDGYHGNTDASIYFCIRLLDGSGAELLPERPVIVKVPVPYGWKDQIVTVSRVGEDGELDEISSCICDGYIVFITDQFSEFVIMAEEAPEPDEGEGEGEGENTEPEETQPPETTPEPEETTTPATTTTPMTTTAPEETETTTEAVTAGEPETTTEPEIVTEEVTTPAEPEIIPEPETTTEPAVSTTVPPEETAPDTSEEGKAPEEAGDDSEEAEETEQPEVSLPSAGEIIVAPTIDVSVPSSITAIINPYGVKVNVGGVEYGATGVASPVYTIVNKTVGVAVKIDGAASLTVPSIEYTNEKGETMSKQSIQVLDSPYGIANQTVKSVCAYVLAQKGTLQVGRDSADDPPDLFESGVPQFDENTLVFADLTDPYSGNTANTGTIAVLDKADDETLTYAQFRISGDITGDSVGKWNESDRINLNLVLYITPAEDGVTDQEGAVAEEDGSADEDDAATEDEDVAAKDDELIGKDEDLIVEDDNAADDE